MKNSFYVFTFVMIAQIIFSGSSNLNAQGNFDFNTIVLTGESADNQFGNSVSGAGDINNDGFQDFIVGANFFGGARGKIYVYFGGSTIDNVPDLTFEGLTQGENCGYRVSSAGDVNNDGFDDFMASSVVFANHTGRVYIFLGGATPDNVPDIILNGFGADNNFGTSVSSGDFNKDGFDDVLIGARGENVNFTNGHAYLYLGGTVMDTIPDAVFNPASPQPGFGNSVSFAGDVNNDNYPDIIIGSSISEKAYIFFGGVAVDTTIDVTLTGNGGFFGNCVASAGDLNNDNYDDVAVGAENYNGLKGIVYLYYGGSSMDNVADDSLTGASDGRFYGSSISSADVDSNGYSDLLIGASGNPVNSAYLVYNYPEGEKKIKRYTEELFINYGLSVSFTGDLNDDGKTDFIIGASGYSGNTGRAFVYDGSQSIPSEIYIYVYAFMQGFYHAGINQQAGDTITVQIRSSTAPYAIIDSVITYLGTNGNNEANPGIRYLFPGSYYFVIRHRNALETWTSQPLTADKNGDLNVSLSSDSTEAYGDNEIRIDTSPLRYGLYSGDVNQDGHINLSDIVIVNNDGSNFLTGYVASDVNGDNVVDLVDALITYDNSTNFISVIKP
ncbi:MAG: FG-GAP repeat protein [Ignavibacteriae bacterium]|nr:FG-GAP repeat protein [Ignavibacteriota bacterium]